MLANYYNLVLNFLHRENLIVYICEKCGKEVTEKFGSGRFCSQSCANSRVRSDEVTRKISDSLKGRSATNGSFKKGHTGIGDRKAAARKASETWKVKRLNRTYEQLSFKEQILFDQNNKCNICGISEWQGKPIVLEIHHKDGNHQNDDRDNVEALCPNCHSQTAFWRIGYKHKKD